MFSQEHILITAHQSRTAEPDGKRTWNKIRTLQKHLGIRYDAFLQWHTLYFSFYTLFLLEYVLLAAHQDITAKGDDKVIPSKLQIIRSNYGLV